MTEDQIGLIQKSFAEIIPQADQIMNLFYNHLFEIAPETKVLFTRNMTVQGREFIDILRIIIGSLRNLPHLQQLTHGLAKRHLGYGVQPENYNVVGDALLLTLQQGLGEKFTPEVKQAWQAAYTILADNMKIAA